MSLKTMAMGAVACGAMVLVTATPVAAQDAPCSVCGPGEHWIDACSAGQDKVTDHGALVGIDTDLDCTADVSTVLGPCTSSNLIVNRSAPLDDSANFPGLRTVDNHSDVIDTEIVSMCLTDGTITLRAGNDKQQGQFRIGQSLGAIGEKTDNNKVADSFFDVFFEIDIGGGSYVYNQTALRIEVDITCVPPQAEYLHPTGCLKLFTNPTPGEGQHVANLVSAEHHVFPGEQGACCTEEGTCEPLTQSECERLGSV